MKWVLSLESDMVIRVQILEEVFAFPIELKYLENIWI